MALFGGKKGDIGGVPSGGPRGTGSECVWDNGKDVWGANGLSGEPQEASKDWDSYDALLSGKNDNMKPWDANCGHIIIRRSNR